MKKNWKQRGHEIIFEADTPKGKAFDVTLLFAILLSVIFVMLESVPSLSERYRNVFDYSEWIFTGFFTLEYIARLIVLKKPMKYVFSFYGLVDLLSILPTYIGIFITGGQSLIAIRILRLLRVFRIFKLVQFIGEARVLGAALRASAAKITVFLGAVLALCVVLGTVMYIVEEPEDGFTSIPRSIYWAIVTLTTVGYGDIAPQTVLGQTIASAVMILGYAIIAVPTGIVSVNLAKPSNLDNTQACPACSAEGHENDAKFCKFCGEKL